MTERYDISSLSVHKSQSPRVCDGRAYVLEAFLDLMELNFARILGKQHQRRTVTRFSLYLHGVVKHKKRHTLSCMKSDQEPHKGQLIRFSRQMKRAHLPSSTSLQVLASVLFGSVSCWALLTNYDAFWMSFVQ